MMSDSITLEAAAERHGINPELLKPYIALRELPDGTLCGIYPQLTNLAIHVSVNDIGYERKFCFHSTASPVEVVMALLDYQGGDDMPGPWIRDTGRWVRRNHKTGKQWPADEPEPEG